MADPAAGDPQPAGDGSQAMAGAGPGVAARAARTRVGLTLAVAGVIALLLTWAEVVTAEAIVRLDTSLTDFTRQWADADGWPVDLAGLIGYLTAPLWSAAAAALLVVVLYASGFRAAAGLLAACGVAGLLVGEVVKRVLLRPRPPGADLFVSDLDRSFPSGHAMVGIYLYLIAGLILLHVSLATTRRWLFGVGAVLVVIGPTIGLSRLVLGVHWPSDVLAGWAFGSTVVCAAALILWQPVQGGWAPRDPRTQPASAAADDQAGHRPPDVRRLNDPEPPAAGATPDPPGR